MFKSQCLLIFFVLLLSFDDHFIVTTKATATVLRFKDVEGGEADVRPLVTKDERKTVTETEYGQVSAVDISDDGTKGIKHHLQFITLEPNSLFLPVLLHADMVFYVHTGSGSLSWVDEDGGKNQFNIQRGDIYRLHSGSVFHIRSSLESKREKLRIYAIFTHHNNANTNQNPQKLSIGAYSTLTDLVLGFDKKVLQTAFNVPEDVLEEITRADKPPAIIHLPSKGKKMDEQTSWKAGIIETLVGGGGGGSDVVNKKKKKTRTFNILDKKPDVENCNGWSSAVNKKDLPVLKGSDIGVFMVNLTQGSMMGPHWNPRASEIAIVTHGQGMIRVVCSSIISNETSSGCKNVRFRVNEGDVFVVPRFHPMSQMSYNNGSLVFMGFTTMARTNHPQFLVGESSVLRTLDRDILAMSFNVPNTTIDRLLGSQVDSIILECVSCAEEEEKTMQKEIEKEREEEEEARREEEEKARERERKREKERRQEEEEARRRQEEEEARRRQEEEAKTEEEEAKKQEEERQAREKREEEERERREEEEEEKEAERREEEAKREEEEAKKQEEERQAREKREEEERKRREEEEEKEAERREEEAKREEEEEAKKQEEERQAREKREEEERKRREEEEKEAERREEEAKREEEEAKREEEERQAREKREEEEEKEAERREVEERAEKEAQEEEERKRKEDKEAQRREKEEAEEEERKRREEEEEAAQRREEEEAARRREEETAEKEARERREEEADERREEEARREEEEARREEEERERGGGGGGEGRRVLKKMWRV